MVVFCILWCSRAATAEQGEIQESVQSLLKNAGRKIELDKLVAPVTKHGAAAVPVLIDAYANATPVQRSPLAICLCRIATEESLDFLKDLLRKHEDDWVAAHVITYFPVEQEDQITLILVDLMGVPRVGFEAQERLKRMVIRKPSRAGELIKAMEPSDPSGTGRNWKIGNDVLAFITGYAFTWNVQVPADADRGAAQRDFWEQWWKRSQGKEQWEWLVDTYDSLAKSASRQAQAVQDLASLKDPRAKDFLIKALDSPVQEVRYWAVIGLRRLQAPDDHEGYLWETFQKEEAQLIEQLKQKYSRNDEPAKAGTESAPAQAGVPQH